jgi:uncharacterized protein (TIGR02757 family)
MARTRGKQFLSVAIDNGYGYTGPMSEHLPFIPEMPLSPDLKPLLDTLYANRSQQHLENDPLSRSRRFAAAEDREVAALISSAFAYGNVKIILKSLDGIFQKMGPSPRRYVERFNPEEGARHFSGFKHRFNDARDLCALLLALRRMIEGAGSIEAFFCRNHDEAAPDITRTLTDFSTEILKLEYGPIFGDTGIPPDSYFPFFFPSPASGSACKRLCMFLRWVVRPDDDIDLGLWKRISPSQLIIPVDLHIRRIARSLGLTARNQADWKMAREITARLRELDPDDPVKYDFSLCHLGISEGCDGKSRIPCAQCGVARLCSGPNR